MRELIQQHRITSIFALPLLIEGEVVGSLGLETSEPRHFLAGEVNLAWSVADQVSGALARARMAQTHERLIAAIEQAAESVIITDTQGAILYVNPAFERISGYSRAEIIGQNPRILNSGQQDEAVYKDMWATISAGQVWHGRFVNKNKAGVLYTEDATVAPVRNSSNMIVSYVGVQRDVTRELQLENQYHQAQKMEAIGRLSGGVAHDFNNLLVVITGYSELLLQRHADPNSTIYKYVEEIKKAGDQAALLTQQLLAFSRRQMLKPKVVDLNLVVAEVEAMLRRLIGEDIELITVLAEELGQVKADPGQIGQVIMNLAINARDAMPHGGKLVIETANAEIGESDAQQRFDLKPGPYVMLAMSDAGVGMDEQTRIRIFEPFFTTKEIGKGTGLGLATVYGIVKQSSGHIWVYSEPGHGTVFKVYLPRIDEGIRRPKAQGSINLDNAPGGVETVLLVEDEDPVRSLAGQALRASGYTVLEARHGIEALSLWEHSQAPIHLLVTDVIMPHMSGHKLAQRLLQLRPELKVLYISGYTDDAIVHHGVLEPGLFFLQKPFTPNSLALKVREVLDAPKN
jgi:PAS domain S-box-containing protein